MISEFIIGVLVGVYFLVGWLVFDFSFVLML